MTRRLAAAAVLVLAGSCASAHRLDEYLQGAILTLDQNRLEVEMTLTPGVAVFPQLIALIDTDADGAISPAEQQAYAARVLADLSLSIDGRALQPQLTSADFPSIDEMREGRGEIRLGFRADLPQGGASRKLLFENRHQTRIAAYQVNVLVPRDPAIRIVRQNRNYSQSRYELDFTQPGAESLVARSRGPLATAAFLAFAWIALAWGVRERKCRA